ncbi:zinc finger HIT domain-containing protein 2 [Lepisosteus oculatus]|uniref:zinc finger HIT domain-containing protein 2 n=1 Tax=Lepisosteus oculatus TaxID=7918 RepID=UPI0035F50D3D
MNVLRVRRLPACVTGLLSAQGGGWTEQEAWAETPTEPAAVGTGDIGGVAVPGRAGAEPGEPLLTPARPCALCLQSPARYTCPRCQAPYCGLGCYRGPRHARCSEDFYRQAVLGELRAAGRAGEEGRRRMQEILVRLREEEEEEEEELAERLAGLDLDALSEEELWGLLPPRDRRRFEQLLEGGAIGALVEEWTPWWERHQPGALVEELGGAERSEGTGEEGGGGERSVGAGGEEEEEGGERSVGTGGEEEEEEEEGGERSVGAGGEEEGGERSEAAGEEEEEGRGRHRAGGSREAATAERDADPEGGGRGGGGRKPRPEEPEGAGAGRSRRRRREVGAPAAGAKSTSAVPPISPHIPPLHTLTPRASPLVGYSLVNVLHAYAFALRRFNGDLAGPPAARDFCRAVLGASAALGSARVFASAPEALGAALGAAREGPLFDREDPAAPERAALAVVHLLSGPGRADRAGYALAALSQLRAALARGGRGRRRSRFLADRKCVFLQAWARENAAALPPLAWEVRREYGRLAGERAELERGRAQLEHSWRGKRPPATKTLIEELD